jgi:hypothetical protein
MKTMTRATSRSNGTSPEQSGFPNAMANPIQDATVEVNATFRAVSVTIGYKHTIKAQAADIRYVTQLYAVRWRVLLATEERKLTHPKSTCGDYTVELADQTKQVETVSDAAARIQKDISMKGQGGRQPGIRQASS